MQQSKLWTKDYIFLVAANFFISLVFFLLMTSLAVYATEQFRASQSQGGLAASIFIIGALFARLFAGKYIDIVGRKKLLYSSLVFFLIFTVLYFFASNLPLLLLIRFIHGAAFGGAATVIATAVMDALPPARRGEGTGYFSLSTAASTAVGPFLALFLSQHYSFNVIFIACTIFSALTIVTVLFVNIKEAELTAEQLDELKHGLKFGDFFEIAALPISLMMIAIGIGYSSIVSFINSYAIEINLTNAASFFFIVYAIFLFISRPIAGKLLDTKSDNIVIYPAILIFALCLVLIGSAKSGFLLLFAGALLAFGYGTLISSMQAIAVKVSPRHRVGLAVSTFFICMDGGMGLGPFLIGFIVPITGFRGMYIMLSILILCMVVVYYFIHGRKPISKTP